ncbi:MAG: hypothetical protein AVDCRST_MAG10-2438 [uncultured Acidimicrobiales bacterium]|uniref:Fe/B12 periplasmic-binding domain-containing protein n=1 Tax=uncultured Acidimicrobiales bacterium TaxID=310071 RepID=A0A6J4IP60_9ACTN|nr:MAG: hypothetical protein AVDCRST_MAG10-2438 [uncultured Acidimicrobiales bacterium]
MTPLASRHNDERIYTIPRPWAQYAAGWGTSTVLFTGGGPDLPTIAALKPELILDGVGFSDSEGYEQLSKIAPTIVRASRDSGKLLAGGHPLSWSGAGPQCSSGTNRRRVRGPPGQGRLREPPLQGEEAGLGQLLRPYGGGLCLRAP